MNKHFNVESYNVKRYIFPEDIIDVMIEKNNKGIPIQIKLEDFELFLITKDKLDWQLDLSNECGEHVQRSGKMTMEEYWEGDLSYIYNDLYEYITTHQIKYKGIIRPNSVESILNAFENYKP